MTAVLAARGEARVKVTRAKGPIKKQIYTTRRNRINRRFHAAEHFFPFADPLCILFFFSFFPFRRGDGDGGW